MRNRINKYRLLSNGILLFVFMLFSSCEKGSPLDCLTSTGSDVTENRASSSFTKIVLEDNVNLVLTQASDYDIKVHGGENLLKKVKTDIEDGVLTIKNNNSCNWMRNFDREITVYADIDIINTIDYRGSGDISCSNTITGDSLLLNVWEGAGKVDMDVDVNRNSIFFHIGTADVYYKGFAQISYVSSTSFGPVHAENMKTVFTYANSEGSNNCYLWCGLDLEVSISNIGNVYYKGEPSIKLNDTGKGDLIKL